MVRSSDSMLTLIRATRQAACHTTVGAELEVATRQTNVVDPALRADACSLRHAVAAVRFLRFERCLALPSDPARLDYESLTRTIRDHAIPH